MYLREDFVDDVAVNVGQSEVATGIAVCQFFVVEAHQSQNCGLQVVNVDGLLDSFEAEFVGRSMNLAALHTAASQPGRIAPVVVVSTVDLAGV